MKRLFSIMVLLVPTFLFAQTDECTIAIETENTPMILPASIESFEIEVNSNCPCEYEGLVASDKWISFNHYPYIQCPGTLGIHVQHNPGYTSREGAVSIIVITDSGELFGKTINVIQEGILPVNIDIKPGACPNSINTKANGVITIAVAGNEEFDVSTIDPTSIRLSREGSYHRFKMPPIRWSIGDEATAFEGGLCDCHEWTGDGFPDLLLKFEKRRVSKAFNLDRYGGETMPFLITGNLYEEYGGLLIEGWDCLHIIAK